MTLKFCNRCSTEKSISDFSKDRNRKDGLNFYCKQCNVMGVKQWQKNNPEKYDAAKRRSVLQKHFKDVSIETYEVLIKQQNGLCAICFTDTPGHSADRKYFDIDHDHKTNEIRGLLCQSCNMGIGQLNDDPQRLRRAAEYLERFK